MSIYKSRWKSIYTKIMMKSNYKDIQNKLQEDYANWFIELIKKKYLKKISFQEISKDFIKNDFDLFIYKKEVYIYFQLMIWFNFICI